MPSGKQDGGKPKGKKSTKKKTKKVKKPSKPKSSIPSIFDKELDEDLFSRPWMTAFLKALSIKWDMGQACSIAGISRTAAYMFKKKDDGFARTWDALMEKAIDSLESSALRRATDGTLMPIIHRGALVIDPETGNPLYIRKFETALTIFMLKCRRKSVYNIDNFAQSESAEEQAFKIQEARKAMASSVPSGPNA